MGCPDSQVRADEKEMIVYWVYLQKKKSEHIQVGVTSSDILSGAIR
jgi:hypothetical protein